jgi:quercetin dioxygenase-like cupin family protein
LLAPRFGGGRSPYHNSCRFRINQPKADSGSKKMPSLMAILREGCREMSLRFAFGWACVLELASLFGASAMAQDLPPGVRALTPDQLLYSESPRAPGVLAAPLFGVPSKAEYYVFRAKYPPNTVNGPHHHPGDEELTVISGTLYVGHGPMMDRAKATAYPPGSYIREPAGTVHFLFTEHEVVEVEIRGMGPRQNIYLR